MTTKRRGESRPAHIGVNVAEAPLSSLLLQVVRAHAAVATTMLQRIGLVAPQELVLLFLQEKGRTPQSDIVHFLGRDRSTVTNTLQAMERAGLVTRTWSDVDRRTVVVALTDKGRRLCPRIREIWAELEQRTFGELTEPQRGELARSLAAIRETLRPSSGQEPTDPQTQTNPIDPPTRMTSDDQA